MFYLYVMIVLVACFAIAQVLSYRAFALLGKSIDIYSDTRWLLAISVVVGVALLLWRILIGVVFMVLAYCIVNAAGAVRVLALRLPPSPSRYLIGAVMSRALGLVIVVAMWASRFWSVMWASRLHL